MKTIITHLFSILLCIIPIGGRIEISTDISLNFIFAIALFLFFILYIIKKLAIINKNAIIGLDVILISIILFFLILNICSGFVSESDELYLSDLKNLIVPLLIYVVFIFTIDNKEQFNIIVKYLVFSGIIEAILCITQTMFFLETRGGKFSGEWGNPNYMAGIITVIFPLLIQKLSESKIIYYLIGIVLLGGVTISFSKSAWFVMVFIMAVYTYLNFEKKNIGKIIIAGCLFIGTIYYIFTDQLLSSFAEEYLFIEAAYTSRLDLIETGLEVFKENYVFGVGMGNYRLYTSSLGFGDIGLEAHNIFITIMVENGIIGLALFLIIIIRVMINYFKLKVPLLNKYAIILSYIAVIFFIATHGGGRYFYLLWLHLALGSKYNLLQEK